MFSIIIISVVSIISIIVMIVIIIIIINGTAQGGPAGSCADTS